MLWKLSPKRSGQRVSDWEASVSVGQEVVVAVGGHTRIKLEEIRDGGSGLIVLVGINDDFQAENQKSTSPVSVFSFHIETRPVAGENRPVTGFRPGLD